MAKISPTAWYELDASVIGFTLKDQETFFALGSGAKYLSFENANTIYQLVNFRNNMPAAFAGGPASVAATSSGSGTEVALTVNEAIIKASDSFTGTPPTNEQFKDTIMVFWNDAAGSPGKVIAAVPYSLFEQFSTAVPAPYA